jgi:branched-chain amino acid transport system permease protein
LDIFIQQIINGLVLGSMYALVALGYTMVYGIINLINFAHGEVLMVGALTSWTVITALQDTGMPGWLLLLISVPLAIMVCSTLNFTIEKVAYRPLRNAPRLAPLITAMGMSLLLQTLAMIIWKPNPKPFPILLPSDPFFLYRDGPVISVVQMLILGITAVVLAGLMYLVNRTKLGRAMRATAENPRVAALMGVKPDMVISATFIIGAALAAVAGIMWAANYGTVQHSMGFLPGLKAFTAAVLGGIGNLAGAVVGGIRRRLPGRAHRRRAGQPLRRHLRLRRADPGADAAALGTARRTRRRPGVTMSRQKQVFLFVALALVLSALPVFVQQFGQGPVRIMALAMLYVLLALGLNIVVGYAGLLDLGFVAFYAVGAYMYALLASPHLAENFEGFKAMFPNGLHTPIWVVIPLAAGLAAIAGVLLGAPVLKLRGDYLAIVTLGFGEIIRVFLNNLEHPVNITNGPRGLDRIDPMNVFGFSFGKAVEVGDLRLPSVTLYYWLFLLLVIGSLLVCYRLAAKAMGINTRNMKLLAFGMGATFGGVSGSMFASFQGFVSPESFSLMESVMIVAMVVVGGIGHLPGVVVGALLLAILPEGLRYVAGDVQNMTGGRIDASILRQLLIALAMIIVMLLRPRGLWPQPEHGKAAPAPVAGK